MSHELEIKLENKYVGQFRLDESVFTVEVDKHRRPQFPESVMEKVPPYIRGLIEDIMRYGPDQVHKCVYVNADHQEWCAETKGLGNCNCDPANVSYRSKKPIQQLGISIGDEYVELKFGESVFKLGLDQNGYPDFPESVTKELPPEIPGIVARRICRMRKEGRTQEQIELEILHEFWCEELAGTGMCSCDLVLGDPESNLGQWYTGSWGALTCVVCHQSSNGMTGSVFVGCDHATLFDKHWVWEDGLKVGRCFWAFSRTTLICEDCLRNIMSKTHIGFPNVIDDVERSPSVRRRRPVRDRGRLRVLK